MRTLNDDYALYLPPCQVQTPGQLDLVKIAKNAFDAESVGYCLVLLPVVLSTIH